jgi:hypothetical protein
MGTSIALWIPKLCLPSFYNTTTVTEDILALRPFCWRMGIVDDSTREGILTVFICAFFDRAEHRNGADISSTEQELALREYR